MKYQYDLLPTTGYKKEGTKFPDGQTKTRFEHAPQYKREEEHSKFFSFICI